MMLPDRALVWAVAYGAAALTALHAARRTGQSAWSIVAAALAALALYLALDLPWRLSRLGRDLAMGQGWYLERALPQGIALAIAALGVAALFWRILTRWHGRARQAALLTLAAAGVVALKTVSLHAIDQLLLRTRMNLLLEPALLAAIMVLAVRRSAAGRLPGPPPPA